MCSKNTRSQKEKTSKKADSEDEDSIQSLGESEDSGKTSDGVDSDPVFEISRKKIQKAQKSYFKLNEQTVQKLKLLYTKNIYPTKKEFSKISSDLNMSISKIINWFKHRRRSQFKKGILKRISATNVSDSENSTGRHSFSLKRRSILINTVKQNLPYYQSIININEPAANGISLKRGSIVLFNGNPKTPGIRYLTQGKEEELPKMSEDQKSPDFPKKTDVYTSQKEYDQGYNSTPIGNDYLDKVSNAKDSDEFPLEKPLMSVGPSLEHKRLHQLFSYPVEEKPSLSQQRLYSKYFEWQRYPSDEQTNSYYYPKAMNNYANSFIQNFDSAYLPYSSMDYNSYLSPLCYPSCMCADCFYVYSNNNYKSLSRGSPYPRDAFKSDLSLNHANNGQMESFYHYF